jgi:uncharacterized protein (DUF885 family)
MDNTEHADSRTHDLLARHAEELLEDYPENATGLGIDHGARIALRSRLSDRSIAGVQQVTRRVSRRLAQLQSVDASTLGVSTRWNLAAMRTAHEYSARGWSFGYGDVALLDRSRSWRTSPYVVTQNSGAFLEIPTMLLEQHAIDTPDDAVCYLARLGSFAQQLDGETVRLQDAVTRGVIAPDFVLTNTLSQIRMLRDREVMSWSLVTSLASRTSTMSSAFAASASKIVAQQIVPALDRQIAELEKHQRMATHDAGVWKLPSGDPYYAWALEAATTTRMTPDEIHEAGREEVQALYAQMDPLLRSQGLTAGTAAERMQALAGQQRFKFADDDEGRQRALQYIRKCIEHIRPRLPRIFGTPAVGSVEVKRMPPEIEPGAPGAYAVVGASAAGKTQGTFWINLRTMNGRTTFNLPTLTYHESIPGHIWQGEHALSQPLFRSLLAFGAYSEGWALYAEQLADELGIYADDPIGRLGYLQSMVFRACRLVVDSGLHARRWTREEAVDWLATATGLNHLRLAAEVDRYCVWPGQACSYKLGHIEINRLRDRSRTALGAQFDLREFNDFVIATGSLPLGVLARSVDELIEMRVARLRT